MNHKAIIELRSNPALTLLLVVAAMTMVAAVVAAFLAYPAL